MTNHYGARTDNREIAEELRKEGMTLQEIADRLGVSRQRVSQYLKTGTVCEERFRAVRETGCIYPGLREWMNYNRCSPNALLVKMGHPFHGTSATRLRNKLDGTTELTISDIKEIMECTGLSFEELFVDTGRN